MWKLVVFAFKKYRHTFFQVAKRMGTREDIVKHKFLQALSSTISPVTASQKDLNPIQLGRLADELMLLLDNGEALFPNNYILHTIFGEHEAPIVFVGEKKSGHS